jgi:predicted nucleotidyltransferase
MSRKVEPDRELSRIKELLIKEYNPKKIIVFGSYTSNNIADNSDLDLVIIMNAKEKFTSRIKKVMKLINPNLSTDVIVYNEEEVQEMTESNHKFFNNEVIKKGKVVYESKA